MTFQNIPGPICGKCQERMTWVAEHIVDSKPMQVFHCEACDKYAAALPGTDGAPVSVAQGAFWRSRAKPAIAIFPEHPR
jgi:hypothetical protein